MALISVANHGHMKKIREWLETGKIDLELVERGSGGYYGFSHTCGSIGGEKSSNMRKCENPGQSNVRTICVSPVCVVQSSSASGCNSWVIQAEVP